MEPIELKTTTTNQILLKQKKIEGIVNSIYCEKKRSCFCSLFHLPSIDKKIRMMKLESAFISLTETPIDPLKPLELKTNIIQHLGYEIKVEHFIRFALEFSTASYSKDFVNKLAPFFHLIADNKASEGTLKTFIIDQSDTLQPWFISFFRALLLLELNQDEPFLKESNTTIAMRLFLKHLNLKFFRTLVTPTFLAKCSDPLYDDERLTKHFLKNLLTHIYSHPPFALIDIVQFLSSQQNIVPNHDEAFKVLTNKLFFHRLLNHFLRTPFEWHPGLLVLSSYNHRIGKVIHLIERPLDLTSGLDDIDHLKNKIIDKLIHFLMK